jgi:tyrosinase
MAVATAGGSNRPARLRHRRNVRTLTPGQLANFRKAIAASQKLKDDRGYQAMAGIHGLPLPISCTHNSELFLPWHRAYLFFFEKSLQDRVPGVTLPWWNWTMRHGEGIPPAFKAAKEADGTPNPLRSSPIQKSGRESGGPTKTTRTPGAPGAPPLPTLPQVNRLLKLSSFLDFQSQLEDLHNGVHVWVGGTMGSIGTSAYDPLFWAHHTMIDRIWRLWQLRHPGARPPSRLLDRALPPFPATVRQTLSVTALGYDYAATTSAAKGTG